ncbi:MAG: glycine cleavage system protein R [Puniceicoccaceae bacterium MED-G30]|jgi:glycine cleavage system regulatory protein|nr:MAG: glycine cleavage system protein R [Puniceicoccaceae bacterium MED-G30]
MLKGSMQSVLVLTISGPDRSGLVERLAEVVAKFGGNWEHCRMAHLAGRFVGLLQVSVPGEGQQDLEVALRCIEGLDVMIAVGDVSVGEPASTSGAIELELLGSDHPGIVRDVFHALATVGVNVEKLSTRTFMGRDSGGMLFEARAVLVCGPDVNLDALRQKLEAIAQDIMVEVSLKRG